MSRPPILFPLFSDLETLEGVGPKTAKNFDQMNIRFPRDLLFTLPHSGIDRRRRTTIKGVTAPTIVTVDVEIGGHAPPHQKGRPYRVTVEDAETTFQLVFFHAREDWLKKQLPIGQRRLVSGKLEIFDGVAQIVHPDHMVRLSDADDIPAFEPVYPLTAGVTLKAMTKAVRASLKRVPELDEWVDAALLNREKWPGFHDAVNVAHAPQNVDDTLATSPARTRLA